MSKESKCLVVTYDNLNQEAYQLINLLYQPLIGADATNLYLTLCSLCDIVRPIQNHRFILLATGYSYERFVELREILEQYLLLKTSKSIRDESYLYEVVVPLKAQTFLKHAVFGRLYLQTMGEEAFEFARINLVKKKFKQDDFYDISLGLDEVLQNWSDQDEVLFEKQQPTKDDLDNVNFNGFDMKNFLANTSQLVLDYKERTEKNLKEIAFLGKTYDLDWKEYRILIGRSHDLKTKVLDLGLLRYNVLNSLDKQAIKNIENNYSLNPVKFLQLKQKGIAVSSADKRLVDSLLGKYQLNVEVANFLIEFALEQTNQRLVKSYVDKIATTWVRLNVDSIEKAKKAINETQGMYTGNKVKQEALPAWYSAKDKIPDKEVNHDEIDESVAKLKARLGENNGKN